MWWERVNYKKQNKNTQKTTTKTKNNVLIGSTTEQK